MRFARFGLLFCLLIFNPSVGAQQPQQTTTPPPAPQDLQAIAVLNQAIAVAGGPAAINAITDYRATGNVTYHWNPEVQGSVTIQGLGLSEIRLDANLPSGVHSESIQNGQTSRKEPDGNLWQYPPPYPVPSSDAISYQPPLFPSGLVLPHKQIALALKNPRYMISYKGILQIDGQSVHDLQLQRVLHGQTKADSMTEYHTLELFIDTNTLQVVMTQDNVPNHIVRQVRYSKYIQVSGVSVPSSISESVGGQNTRDIQLNQIVFNSGLQDSAFLIQ